MLWLIKYADTTAMESPALIAYLLICMFVCKKNFIIENSPGGGESDYFIIMLESSKERNAPYFIVCDTF